MKVYCENCKHYEYYGNCNHPNNFSDTFEKPKDKRLWTAHKQNSDNGCTMYENKTKKPSFWNAIKFIVKWPE